LSPCALQLTCWSSVQAPLDYCWLVNCTVAEWTICSSNEARSLPSQGLGRDATHVGTFFCAQPGRGSIDCGVWLTGWTNIEKEAHFCRLRDDAGPTRSGWFFSTPLFRMPRHGLVSSTRWTPCLALPRRRSGATRPFSGSIWIKRG
jgi:hypothetical protein